MKPIADITGGNVLRIPAIRSPNYVANVSGWTINQDGSAQFNNATFIGSITITNGNELLIYNTAAPAAGSIVMALSPSAGSDTAGNTWGPGFTLFDGTTGATVANFGANTGFLFANPDALVGFSMTLSGVPVLILSAAGVHPSTVKGVHGAIYATTETLELFASTATVAVDSHQSVIVLKLTESNGLDAADARFDYQSTAGTTTLLKLTNGQVAIPVALVVTGKTTHNEQVTISEADVNGALFIAQTVTTTGNPGTITQQESAAGNGAYAVFVSGDTSARFVWDSNGRLRWGPGNAGLDVIMGRAAAGVLYTSKNLLIGAAAALGDNGVGELQLANAATEPTTNPTGGGVLYAKSAVPKWRDSGGLLLGMVRSYDQDSTGTLASFTAEADIPGATINVVVTGSNATVLISGQFDFQAGGTACTFVGLLQWNGADRTTQAIFVATAAGQRATVGRSWRITGVAAGTYTAKLRATCTVNNASNSVNNPHTGLTIQVHEG